MRALKAATIVMGVLILLGTAVVIATIIKRATQPAPNGSAGVVPAGAAYAAVLREPAGSEIAGLAAVGDSLALALHGGGPDRVVLFDPRTGEAQGRITLAP